VVGGFRPKESRLAAQIPVALHEISVPENIQDRVGHDRSLDPPERCRWPPVSV